MKHSSLLKQSVRYVLTMHHHEEKVTNKRTPKSISGYPSTIGPPLKCKKTQSFQFLTATVRKRF